MLVIAGLTFATRARFSATASPGPLANAIAIEARRRQMEPFERLTIPSPWGAVYERTARSVPYCADAAGIDAARDLATALVDPALDGTALGLIWRSQERRWVSP